MRTSAFLSLWCLLCYTCRWCCWKPWSPGHIPTTQHSSVLCIVLFSHSFPFFPDMKPKVEPVASAWTGAADPWVPVPDPGGVPLSQASSSSQQTSAGPWDFPPSTTAASDPWGKAPMSSGFPPADPWGSAAPPTPQGSSSTPAPDPWAAVPEQPPAPGKRLNAPFGSVED